MDFKDIYWMILTIMVISTIVTVLIISNTLGIHSTLWETLK